MLSLRELNELFARYAQDPQLHVREFQLGQHSFHFNSQSYLMGVINLSADSWYRESVCPSTDTAVRRGRILKAQGADIVDVGAESSLASASRVDDALQKRRLLPIVRELSCEGISVSVETYQTAVAAACLEAGAKILNFTGDRDRAEVFRIVAEHKAAIILCHVQGDNVRDVGDFDFGADPIEMLRDYFARRIDEATHLGVERIFIDPGLGFYYRNLQDSATRIRHQMNVFLNTFRLRRLGVPVCHALPHAFECFGEEVRCAEPFFAVLAALGQTDLFRTHEVPRTRAVLETLRLW